MYINPLLRTKTGETPILFDRRTALAFPSLWNAVRRDYIQAALADRAAQGEGERARALTFRIAAVTPLTVGETEGDIGGHAEEYAILFGYETEIIAPDDAGLLLGFAMLLQAIDAGETQRGALYHYPKFPLRGYRAFLPGRDKADFYRAVDLLAYYQYNTLFLEIGGAMEYRRHPEINEAWVAYARDMHRYTGRTAEVTKGARWSKNSIHPDNGEGGFLSQKECREIAAYCRARGIRVIPEVPLLSHADYILQAHPELRERENDPYPDTYCPRHPATYPLVFDILDEVLDVFTPDTVHIGHDECYSIGVCPRCRGTAPARLYADDIIKIHDYLAKRGVKTAMWGEKLLPATYPNGRPIGGSEKWKWYPDGTFSLLQPRLFDCAPLLPRDILMLHWYWPFNEKYDEIYRRNGYEMVYGNASLMTFEHWNARSRYAKGAIASNWGSYAPEYMQRNLQTSDLVFNARALVSHDYDGSAAALPAAIDRMTAELYRYLHRGEGDVITVTHTTPGRVGSGTPFYDGAFIVDSVYLLGEYELTFDDGFVARLPVKYGTNISNCEKTGRKLAAIAEEDPLMEATEAYRLSYEYRETAGATLPAEDADGKLWYRTVYPHPHAGHKIAAWKYVPLQDVPVWTKEIQ